MDSLQQPIRYKEKSVIIHRDENGFGLRVGGQNPVFVDCVHENGAAWKAGVRKDDRIIKVNGTLVRSYDHQRVVHMIQNCTPFVNLTLHSPEPVLTSIPSTEQNFNVVPNVLQSTEPNNVCASNSMILSSNQSNSSSNLVSNNITLHNLQQRLLPQTHPISNNVNWLLDIGDDLFQDNQQKTHQQVNNSDFLSGSPKNTHHPVGVSKLVVSGPSPIATTSHSHLITGSGSSGKPKLRHNRNNQSSTRDNPYYYYKTAPEKATVTEASSSTIPSSDSATTSLLSQDQGTSKQSSSLSIVRSRSGSKMSTRSTTGKFKSRNLRSRLVDDLRSLTITNSQATPSSLSTSPSSSDLSDCDDQDSSRFDCVSMNTSNSSASGILTSNSMITNLSGSNLLQNAKSGLDNNKPRHTTRRLEIIRELIDTEKTHTERLKHLNDLLYKPIKAEGLVPAEQLKMVFSCHKTLFKVHRQIYKILLAAQKNKSEYHQEQLIGKALVEIFEGELGKRLEKAASTFCACQSTNTELLNRFTRKDTKVGEFLAQVANQQMLGRLGIKDLLASCFQRLTKYPLLLENLLKATPTGTCGIHSKSLSEGSIVTTLASSIVNSETIDDLSTNNNINPSTNTNSNEPIDSVVESIGSNDSNQTPVNNIPDEIPEEQLQETSSASSATNTITNTSTNTTTMHNITIPTITTTHINNPVTTTLEEDYAYERLCISRALHQSRQILIHVNDAVKKAISHNKLRDIWKKTDKYPSLPVIDIETQQMLHEGPLTLRLARRSFEVYVLLLTHYLVILTREGQDKYKLKYFTADGKSANLFSPIFNIDEHLATRDTATDENGFYLLCKRKDEERIYEFASQSPAERIKWKEKIHMAQISCNYASIPDDDNTLTRYRELITLATSSNTPNNIEYSHTNNFNINNNNIVATTAQSTSSLNEVNYTNNSNTNNNFNINNSSAVVITSTPSASTTIVTSTSASGTQPINSNNIGHDLNVQAQDV